MELKKEKDKIIVLDNNIKIGECQFIVDNDKLNIIHTYVDEKYRGKGIAQQLVNCVIEEARKNNRKIVADCSYAKDILMKKV